MKPVKERKPPPSLSMDLDDTKRDVTLQVLSTFLFFISLHDTIHTLTCRQ